MTRRILPVLPFAALAFAVAAPAHAEDLSFSYRAYELESEDGRQVVLERLEREAARHCDYVPAKRPLWELRAAVECHESIMTDVVNRIGDVRLTAQFDERGIRLAEADQAER
ncbi:hypothetical protein DDZ18_04810 [Marinicauda salina]|uniref:UrcA family protein n=1 Tax=Marinicauda salina TaxID=2135793 RepID=A0A2U2BV88_9PROT|nr:UrcA family protein [Marinicauda salina]PWE17900.1 hypothetical protein DDZ18_04810 [Marinicauda salina]